MAISAAAFSDEVSSRQRPSTVGTIAAVSYIEQRSVFTTNCGVLDRAYINMSGRYFDEWRVGDRLAHGIRRTVTETDNLLISALTHNAQPLHLDAESAAASEFGRILVNGTFTFALTVGLSVGDTTAGTLVANLSYDKVVMPKPAFIGDTMHAESEIVELRASRSRPNAGIVTFRHRLLNQRDELVCELLRTALLMRRPSDLQPRYASERSL